MRLLRLPKGTEAGLPAKLDAAASAVEDHRGSDAIVAVEDFIKHVEVQAPRRIPEKAAADLDEFAREILTLLNGGPS